MELKILKTPEISDEEWEQVRIGFNESFDKSEDIQSLKSHFCECNKLGYSYHCFAYSDDGNLMGYTEFSPTFYKEDLKICVGGQTFIRAAYRQDFLLFAKIVNALKKRCAEDGCRAVVAVPNINSRDYAIRINKFVYVDDLNYYILPLNPSRFLHKPSLILFDGFVSGCCRSWVFLNCALSKLINPKAKETKIQLETDEYFYKSRFKEKRYKQISDKSFYCCYTHYNEDGADVIYLMDFRQNGKKTYRSLSWSLGQILSLDKADAILFVGFLNMKQLDLIKIPRRMVPKHLPLTYHVIDKSDKELKEIMSHKESWDFSLMNFDVR